MDQKPHTYSTTLHLCFIDLVKQEFATRLQAQLILMLEIANINGAAQPGYVNVAVSPQQLGNSDRILEVSITGTAITDNHLENLVIQTPQRQGADFDHAFLNISPPSLLRLSAPEEQEDELPPPGVEAANVAWSKIS